MNFNIKTETKYYLIEIEGELVGLDANDILSAFSDEVDQISKPIVFDLTKTTHIDSRGLGVMVLLFTRSKKAGCEFALFGVCDDIMKILKITSLDSIFKIYKDSAELHQDKLI